MPQVAQLRTGGDTFDPDHVGAVSVDSIGQFAYERKEGKGDGGGREVQEGGDMCIPMADSC